MVDMHPFWNVFGHSLGAIVGVIGANYLADITSLNPWTELIGGAIVFIIPVAFLRGNGSWEGPTRLALGVAGLTLVLRSLLGYGSTAGVFGSVSGMPSEVTSVI